MLVSLVLNHLPIIHPLMFLAAIIHTYHFTSTVRVPRNITYCTLDWQLFPWLQVCTGVQAGRRRTLLRPAVRQLWWTKMPKTGRPLQWHPVWWDAAWIQQQNPASQLGTDIPNDLPVTKYTSTHIHTNDCKQMFLFFYLKNYVYYVCKRLWNRSIFLLSSWPRHIWSPLSIHSHFCTCVTLLKHLLTDFNEMSSHVLLRS